MSREMMAVDGHRVSGDTQRKAGHEAATDKIGIGAPDEKKRIMLLVRWG